MKRISTLALMACLMTPLASPLFPTMADAGPIKRACKASDRSAATPSLCRCIQKAANIELSRAEQRRASKFFKDPHRAQEVRQSDRTRDEVFWDRYKKFGLRAEAMCG